MLEHRQSLLRHGGRLIAVALFSPKQGRIHEGQLQRAHREIARRLRILAKRPYEPEQIVRAARADAPVAVRVPVPPVHHVPLAVLVAAAVEDLRAGGPGIQKQEVYAVLQLVAKAECPAALIEAASGKQPAGPALVGRPEVHIVIQRRIWALQADTLQIREPSARRVRQQLPRVGGVEGAAQRLLLTAEGEDGLRLRPEPQPQRGGAEVCLRLRRDGDAGHQLRPLDIGGGIGEAEQPFPLFRPKPRAVRAEGRAELPDERQPLRASHREDAQIAAEGDRERRLDPAPCDLSLPAGKSGPVFDLAGARAVREEAHGLAADEGIQALRAADRPDLLRRREQGLLPRVFEPEARGAEVRREAREAAVCQHMLPDPGRQRVRGDIEKARLRPAVGRDRGAALRYRQQ